MKIATWNVNSIRARINNIKKYLKSSSPDIVISPSKFLLNYYKEKKFFKDSEKYVLPNPILNIFKEDYIFTAILTGF